MQLEQWSGAVGGVAVAYGSGAHACRRRRSQKDRAEQVGTFHELCCCAGEAHLALLHEDGALRQRRGDVHGLLDDHDRRSCVVELPDHIEQHRHDRGREPERELVDHEQPRAAEEGLGDGQHLLLAAGQ